MYLFRLDDASEYMDNNNWRHIEGVFYKNNIKPIVGIIPQNCDRNFVDKYERDDDFWARARSWQRQGWTIAIHGYRHVYLTSSGGVNPVNNYSEFAGIPLLDQRKMLSEGVKGLYERGLSPKLFFAPGHTFDKNTLEALFLETNIRIISDTLAYDVYKAGEFYFIPQQIGHSAPMPFRLTTICLHPNEMTQVDFDHLEGFIEGYRKKILGFDDLILKERRLNILDLFCRQAYFSIKKYKGLILKEASYTRK